MRRLAAIVAGLLLTGCANWEAHQSAQELRYLGRPVDALYDEYGVPVGIAPTSDGGRFLEFQSFRRGFECTAKVTTDRRGVISKIKTGGQNGCVTPL
ncbi:MAG: hypothetical protein E5Y65_08885 [Mesorhizobium sp.]|uniref:hypothetical protein n=1 Tax=Mesorhizobium sp. TaxID=1871066 RepID=UPI0011F574D8|nr:hypothetical protein [Mesorhizobium sp.]TIL71989.1 MAG: hypothetical protein E5Y70_23430 [Mesorhizobium sp.]TIL91737.1 MAG: hypothetical protein E5Y65_08885 [Mesorhizobium sp.]TIM00658.1 MAG: hypothetical protein E5Y64_14180 [Mesorhizobium sp.]